MRPLEMEPVFSETVSPKRFLEIHAREAHDVAAVRLEPPVLGRPGFGRIVVERRTPVFRLRTGW